MAPRDDSFYDADTRYLWAEALGSFQHFKCDLQSLAMFISRDANESRFGARVVQPLRRINEPADDLQHCGAMLLATQYQQSLCSQQMWTELMAKCRDDLFQANGVQRVRGLY